MTSTLRSILDPSVNFVQATKDGGFFESRYVRREAKYLTCYLSSHSGCVKGCSFCHLTKTGQTMFTHATEDDFILQARRVLEHYEDRESDAEFVYFSFMARGEPLANKNILAHGDAILTRLGTTARSYGLASRFCISTIMPVEISRLELADVFHFTRPMIYYSLYSLNPDFRSKWIPQGMDPRKALEKLARWQDDTGMLVKIHGTIIKGENDSLENWKDIVQALDSVGLRTAFNLVPFNPYDENSGEPADMSDIEKFLLDSGMSAQTKTRVGADVKASCGMFVEPSV